MEARRRAPRRQGHRTTLTLPPSLLAAAEQLAQELSTTSNDAIVRLAEEGAASRERRARTADIAAERRAAVEQAEVADALQFPSAAEVRKAMLSGRKLG